MLFRVLAEPKPPHPISASTVSRLNVSAVSIHACTGARLKLHDVEAIGMNIVKRALEEPMRQIAQNAGHEGARKTSKYNPQ